VCHDLKQALAELRHVELPFHPIILVFATGEVSREDCLPMRRSPMPEVGAPFDATVAQVLTAGVQLNPSVHDGAVIFRRASKGEPYRLSAWSMRIVSRHEPHAPEPNLGSAYNSVLSLSMAQNVDMCCTIAPGRLIFFESGQAYWYDE
jgi:hypothetical protein